jgi:hypothetical protein
MAVSPHAAAAPSAAAAPGGGGSTLLSLPTELHSIAPGGSSLRELLQTLQSDLPSQPVGAQQAAAAEAGAGAGATQQQQQHGQGQGQGQWQDGLSMGLGSLNLSSLLQQPTLVAAAAALLGSPSPEPPSRQLAAMHRPCDSFKTLLDEVNLDSPLRTEGGCAGGGACDGGGVDAVLRATSGGGACGAAALLPADAAAAADVAATDE